MPISPLMVIGSSMLTFATLVGIGVIVGLAYVLLMFQVGRRGGSRAASRPDGSRPLGRLSLRAVVNQLVTVDDEETVFLDRTSHRFVTLGDSLRGDLESNEPVEDLIDDTSTLTPDQLEELRVGLRSKVLLQLPTKAQTKEFMLREQFCDQLADAKIKDQMHKVLRGQTGFRSFDGAVERLGIAQHWYRHRDTAFAGVAAAWLNKHRIAFELDVELPDAGLRKAS